jgi:hypothetical protein
MVTRRNILCPWTLKIAQAFGEYDDMTPIIIDFQALN